MDSNGLNQHRSTNLLIGSLALILVSVIRVFYQGIQDLILDVYDGNSLTIPRIHSFTRVYIRASSFLVFLIKLLAEINWSDLHLTSHSVKGLSQHERSSFSYSALSQGDHESNFDSSATIVNDVDDFSASDDASISSSHFLNEPAAWIPINGTDESDRDDLTDEGDGLHLSQPEVDIKYIRKELRKKRKIKFNNLTEVRMLSPAEAEDALLSRLSYQASEAIKVKALKAANRLKISSVAWLSLKLSLIWFLSHFFYSSVISRNSVESTEFSAFIYASSVIFVTFTIALFIQPTIVTQFTGQVNNRTTYNIEADRLTFCKLLAIAFALLSIVFVTSSSAIYSSSHSNISAASSSASLASSSSSLDSSDNPSISKSVRSSMLNRDFVQSLVSAISHSIFIVVLRREVGDAERLDIPLFLGLLGLFQVVTLWPGFFYISNTPGDASASFPTPSTSADRIFSDIATLYLGDVIFMGLLEFLWIWCCLTTSALISSMALLLRIPLGIACQRILFSNSPSSSPLLPVSFWLSTLALFISYGLLVYATKKSVSKSFNSTSLKNLFIKSPNLNCLWLSNDNCNIRHQPGLILDDKNDNEDDRQQILTQET